jgi:hypothetical protein
MWLKEGGGAGRSSWVGGKGGRAGVVSLPGVYLYVDDMEPRQPEGILERDIPAPAQRQL